MRAALPADEQQRLERLYSYDVLDTLPEQAYDDITYLAAQLCGSEIAVVSLVDRDRQWFKSVRGLDVRETPRDMAFCAHAILQPEELLVVPDATVDIRFAGNPLVTADPSIRFYAGAPLVSGDGSALGTLCVIDRQPRELEPQQARSLEALSRQVMAQLELRVAVRDLEQHATEQHRYRDQLEQYQRKLEEAMAAVAEQSVTDHLTGIKNRRALMERLNEEVQRAARSGGPVSVAMVDVDAFKAYNDAHGHAAGDAVLLRVAELLEAESRATDLVARYGGEEFAVVLSETDAGGAQVMAERFRKSVEWNAWPERTVTVSIGVATAVGADAEPSSLLAAADGAMYRAKDAGRNRVEVA